MSIVNIISPSITFQRLCRTFLIFKKLIFFSASLCKYIVIIYIIIFEYEYYKVYNANKNIVGTKLIAKLQSYLIVKFH